MDSWDEAAAGWQVSVLQQPLLAWNAASGVAAWTASAAAAADATFELPLAVVVVVVLPVLVLVPVPVPVRAVWWMPYAPAACMRAHISPVPPCELTQQQQQQQQRQQTSPDSRVGEEQELEEEQSSWGGMDNEQKQLWKGLEKRMNWIELNWIEWQARRLEWLRHSTCQERTDEKREEEALSDYEVMDGHALNLTLVHASTYVLQRAASARW
jgi:hypothetical protein